MDAQDVSAKQTVTGRDLISTLAPELWDNIVCHFIPPQSAFDIHAAFSFGPTRTRVDGIRPCLDVVRQALPLASTSKTIRRQVFASSVCRYISFFPLQHYKEDVERHKKACGAVDRLVDAIREAGRYRKVKEVKEEGQECKKRAEGSGEKCEKRVDETGECEKPAEETGGEWVERPFHLTLSTAVFYYYRRPDSLGSKFDELLPFCNKIDLRITDDRQEDIIASVLNILNSRLTHLAITGSYLCTRVPLPSTLLRLQCLHLHDVIGFDVSLLRHYRLLSLRLHDTSILSLLDLLLLITSQRCPKRLSVVDIRMEEEIDPPKSFGVWALWPDMTHLQACVGARGQGWAQRKGVHIDLLALLNYCSVSVLYAFPQGCIEDGRVLDTNAVNKCTWIKARAQRGELLGSDGRRSLYADTVHLIGGRGGDTLVNLAKLETSTLLLRWLESKTQITSVVLKGAVDQVLWGALVHTTNLTSVEFTDVLDWEMGGLQGEPLPSSTSVVISKCVASFAADVICITHGSNIFLEKIYEEEREGDETVERAVEQWLRNVGHYHLPLLAYPASSNERVSWWWNPEHHVDDF
jgi:hypothetical protein